MKKRILSLALYLAIVAAIMLAMCVTVSADDGEWKDFDGGTCHYKIVKSGDDVTLTIAPKAGNSGTLPDGADNYNDWPWYNSGDYDDITKVVIEKGVKAGDSTAYMFYYFENITEITGLSNLDTSAVTNMSGMFYDCYQLKSLDLSRFNTSKVTDMSYMFYCCMLLSSLDLSSFDTSKVENMYEMFCYCEVLSSLDLSGFDTSKVTNMSYMFYYCYNLRSLDLSSFNTSKVTDMSYMFYYCKLLSSLDLSSFDTSEVKTMYYMFSYCYNLRLLDLSGFNTKNVTTMSCMFCSCHNLRSLDLSSFNTSEVTDMSYMFYDSINLITLDLSSFDTSKVETMKYMFCYCCKLKTIYASDKFVVKEGCNDEYMLYGCTSLVGGKGTKFNTSKDGKEYARIDGGTANPGYFTKSTIFNVYYNMFNYNINRLMLLIKNYYVKFNKTYFFGKLDLSWLFS